MATCFRFKRDADDMRLEWDAYIDSTLSSEERTWSGETTTSSSLRADMTDRGVQCYNHDQQHIGPMYRDGPSQPLLASRGSYLGQIKLSVYLNCGLLTCHVIQARHLSSKRGGTCDPLVKLSLVPDESLRTRCKTDVVMDTNNPLFDEKFSFELIQEDMKKRLYISVWNKIPGKECKDEFLGCMSFGIRHIQNDKRAVNGWYYLLNDDIGRKKHLQATVKKQHLKEQVSNTSNGSIPKVNQDILWMDPYTLTIRKEKSGYGFTVSGFSPVFVCKIEKGSAAEQAGLQKDDCIVRIDGLNVSRSTSDSVAKIIRGTSKQLTLEIQRPQVVTTASVAQASSSTTSASAAGAWYHQAVSSTPMTRSGSGSGGPPPAALLPPHILHNLSNIPTRAPLPPARPPPPPPPPPHQPLTVAAAAAAAAAPPALWDVEVESKEPVYGNCGVFGESDPLYSTVSATAAAAMAAAEGGQRCHSSASSSDGRHYNYHQGDEPEYGMIRVVRSGGGSCGGSSCRTSSTSSGTMTHQQLPVGSRGNRNSMTSSSTGSTSDVIITPTSYTTCQLPRKSAAPIQHIDDCRRATGVSTLPRGSSSSRNAMTTTVAPHPMNTAAHGTTAKWVNDHINIDNSNDNNNYVAFGLPKSISAGTITRAEIYNHYRLCHDSGDDVIDTLSYPLHPTSQGVTSHEDYGIYGHTKSLGSAGSTGSADSGSFRRSRTLPRKKKVHFQEQK